MNIEFASFAYFCDVTRNHFIRIILEKERKETHLIQNKMTRRELDSLYVTLRNDVSSLVDTTDSMKRVQKDENGNLHVAPARPVSTNEQRVKRILGAICPIESAESCRCLFHPTYFKAVEEELARQDRSCITQNFDVCTILLLLREDDVIEYGKTPLCEEGDPTEFLKKLISSSDVTYKDTMLAILEDQRDTDKPIFIDDDPFETPGEKFDRAVLLLSLLSKEEIYEYGGEIPVMGQTTQGIFCQMFNSTFAEIAPLFYLGLPKYKYFFNCAKFKDGWVISEKEAQNLAETFSIYNKAESNYPIAMDDCYYRNVLRQCLRAGVSVSGWLYRWDVAMKDSSINCHAWLFEHYDEGIINMIISNKGYYLIALDEISRWPLLHGKDYLPFRKHIVDNGYLVDVFQMYVPSLYYEPGKYLTYIEILAEGLSQQKKVRFFNCEHEWDPEKVPSYKDILFGNPEEENDYYRFVSAEKIVEEAYSLDMDLYNATEYRKCGNPVKLKEILTLLKGESKRIEPYHFSHSYGVMIRNVEFGYPTWLNSNALENYKESIEPESDNWLMNGDVILDTGSALLLKSSWPMQPTWVNVVSSIADRKHRKIVLGGALSQDDIKAFSLDTQKANPWYVAYQISQKTRQFMLRSDENGLISDEQFLRMYIDLPSLEEQNEFVEKVIGDEIERKKKQVGAVETLYTLSHLIGSPSSKIQTMLGNLIEICEGDVEKTTMLKIIQDNFDYIDRRIKTFSQDFKNWNVPLKTKRILPLVEKCVASSASLPSGIVPRLDSSRIDGGITAKVNDLLFEVAFDNIIRNAYVHGFDKKISPENRMRVALDIVQYKEKDHLLISVCNNGHKLEDGFTVNDFVELGRKGRITGNTGQGGYDIYQIVKRFKGFLGLRSAPDWNFVIDILIPVAGIDPDKIYKQYEYGPLL